MLTAESDLETILAAWHEATDRLQQTHEVLRDEVGRLTDELEEKNRELARKNRLADLGQMASHVAHEVRNSLVPLKLYLSLLRRRLTTDDESRGIVEKIASGFAALETTVSDLLNFTSERDPQWMSFAVSPFLREICESLQPQFQAQRINARCEVAEELMAFADRDMLRRAVLNLVLNAVDVLPNGGELVCSAVSDGQTLSLEVADSGPGIPESQLERLFEPFFTTKSGGTGLGLAIVERIATAHGGCVSASNRPTGGALFRITLPESSFNAHT